MTPRSQAGTWRPGCRWLCASLLVASGCRDATAPPPPLPGDALVSATATGLDLPFVLQVTVDDRTLRGFALGGSTLFGDLAPGTHKFDLDVPDNCTVDGPNPRDVAISSQDTTAIAFDLTCTASVAVLNVQVTSAGVDFPNTYLLHVGTVITGPVVSQGLSVLTNLKAGSHQVGLQGVPPNCTVSGDNPRTISVTTGGATRDTAETTFDISCVAVYGLVEVNIQTTGEDLDLGGYRLKLGTTNQGVGPNIVIRAVMNAGDVPVALEEIAPNCAIAGQATRTLTITTGGLTRDTARTAFTITCAKYDMIAFTRFQDYAAPVMVLNAGTQSTSQTGFDGVVGSWSATGKRAVIQALVCDYYYYYYGCSSIGLRLLHMDSLPSVRFTQLTTDWRDGTPSMSPDESKIAFTRADRIMKLEDSVFTTLVAPGDLPGLTSVSWPRWSPDGSRIVFSCGFGTWMDICVVEADKSNLTRLTFDPYTDVEPSWSLDGTRILLSSNRGTTDGVMHVATMNASGGDYVRLVPGGAPSWSPDGSRIVFSRFGAEQGVHVMKADGTEVTRLTTGNDYAAVWRP